MRFMRIVLRDEYVNSFSWKALDRYGCCYDSCHSRNRMRESINTKIHIQLQKYHTKVSHFFTGNFAGMELREGLVEQVKNIRMIFKKKSKFMSNRI